MSNIGAKRQLQGRKKGDVIYGYFLKYSSVPNRSAGPNKRASVRIS